MNLLLNKKIFYTSFFVLIWGFVIFAFADENINYPSFWYDESGQFWIAKGLNHFSQTFSESAGINEVLKNNIKFNLDPGGFSVILHFWTMISNNHIFLRLLPFTFFIVAMLILVRLSLEWSPRNPLAYLGGFILLQSMLLSQYAFELRPYSMEMLAVIASLYFCYRIDNIFNNYRYALFSGIFLAILLSSRYSALFAISSLLVVVFYNFFFKKEYKKNIMSLIIFIVPITVSAILIYILTLRYQNPTGVPPIYVNDLMMSGGNISNILLNKASLLVLFPFLSLVFLYIISIKSIYFKRIINPYKAYMTYAFILNSIFIVLSYLGKYPWAINSRWDISTHAIFVIAWLPIIFIATNFLYDKKHFLFKYSGIFIVLIFSLYFFDKASSFKYSALDSIYYNFTSNNVSINSNILTNAGATPSVKYLFEYGSLKRYKKSYIYKNLSFFDHAEYKNNDSIRNLDNIDKYDYIILSHFDYANSDLKNILKQKSNWIDVSKKEPSKIFENTRVAK